jgi:Secretion system C-terminal sorting domain
MNKLRFLLLLIVGFGTATVSNAQWVQNTAVNTPICTAIGIQSEPKIIPDGVGGAYIVWKDFRNFNSPDAFLQRINKEGVSLWIVDGLNVCVNQEDQSTPNICSDGEYGVIASWSDFRNTTDRNIYAQRIDSNGIIQWNFNGVVVTNKSVREYNEEIISDGAGGAIIAWEQGSNNIYDIWAQRIDASGTPMWASGGIALSTASSNKLNPTMALGADNNVYCVWQDQRNGNTDVFAQKLDLMGNRLWGNAAKSVVVETDRQEEPRIALTQNKLGMYVTWVDRRQGNGNNDIYAQKLDSAGTKLWVSTALPICTAISVQNQVEILTDGVANGFITSWRDYRNGGTSDIYAQKVDSNGLMIFAANGLAINADGGDQLNAVLTKDTNGGVIITWQDKNGGNSNIRAQKIDAAGNAKWGIMANVCTAVGEQISPKTIPDGEDGLIAVWQDGRDTGNQNIMGQRIRKIGTYVVTSTIDLAQQQVAVWPNPFTNTIHIQNPKNLITECTMLDIIGRAVTITRTLLNNELVISTATNMANGVYFLQIKENQQLHTIKVIKQ